MFENLKLILKQKRGFNPIDVLQQKIEKINLFFEIQNLDSCVVGISGGIDSALVVLLLLEAQKQKNSPIKKICGITAPIYESVGITKQKESVYYASLLHKILVSNKYKNEFHIKDLTRVSKEFSWLLNKNNEEDPYLKGQVDYLLRSPLFYGYANLLNNSRYKSIVLGTTNRDEGEYIGFCGKSSDLMVDLQPIADLHKSEVFYLAKLLNCPHEILNRKPCGDLWNSKNDEEVFGFSYEFLEMYMQCRDYLSVHEFLDFYKNFTIEEKKLYDKNQILIENLHRQNLHKYEVGRPSHYIDILKRICL